MMQLLNDSESIAVSAGGLAGRLIGTVVGIGLANVACAATAPALPAAIALYVVGAGVGGQIGDSIEDIYWPAPTRSAG